MANKRIIMSTTDTVAGRDIAEVLDVVVGISEFGGYHVPEMTQEKQRLLALDRLEDNALKIGADAVVGIRFDSVVIKSSHSYDFEQIVEYTAYGTAVKLR